MHLNEMETEQNCNCMYLLQISKFIQINGKLQCFNIVNLSTVRAQTKTKISVLHLGEEQQPNLLYNDLDQNQYNKTDNRVSSKSSLGLTCLYLFLAINILYLYQIHSLVLSNASSKPPRISGDIPVCQSFRHSHPSQTLLPLSSLTFSAEVLFV